MDKSGESGSRKRKLSPHYNQGFGGDQCVNHIILKETEQILDILQLENNEVNVLSISSKLENNFYKENRLLLVVNELLNSVTEKDLVVEEIPVKKRKSAQLEDSFFSDLALLIGILKTSNPDLVVDENLAYETLKNHADQEGRVNLAALVILKNCKPKDSDQAATVGDDLLRQGEVLEEFVEEDSNDVECIHETLDDSANLENTDAFKEMKLVETLMKMLTNMFPDVSRAWLRERINEQTGNPDCVQFLSNVMTEQSYPKEEKAKAGPSRQELKELKLEDEEFLKMFPDPRSHFYVEGGARPPPSESYVRNALYELVDEFKVYKSNHVERVFARTSSYATTRKSLLSTIARSRRNSLDRVYAPAAKYASPPEVVDEGFFKELWFVKNEDRIMKLLAERDATRSVKMREAERNGMLFTCPICFDDRVLPDEVLSCSADHEFCFGCVRRSTEIAVGEGVTRFKCLSSDDCEGEFPPSTILSVLPRHVYDRVMDKRLEQDSKVLCEEFSDLAQCPHCVYMVSMPDPEDKVLKCLNPDCLRETCRLCKEPSHIPLRCEEVEKSEEMAFRKKMEMEMTEAMVRVCPKCQKRFFKEEGCNKMTCKCGTTMCYVCRKPNVDYKHFGKEPGMCSLENTAADLHAVEINQAVEKVKVAFTATNPNLTLKHDPSAPTRPLPRPPPPPPPPPPLVRWRRNRNWGFTRYFYRP